MEKPSRPTHKWACANPRCGFWIFQKRLPYCMGGHFFDLLRGVGIRSRLHGASHIVEVKMIHGFSWHVVFHGGELFMEWCVRCQDGQALPKSVESFALGDGFPDQNEFKMKFGVSWYPCNQLSYRISWINTKQCSVQHRLHSSGCFECPFMAQFSACTASLHVPSKPCLVVYFNALRLHTWEGLLRSVKA